MVASLSGFNLSGSRRHLRTLLQVFILVVPLPLQAALTLEQAVMLAREGDPWLRGSELRETALLAESTAAGTLPDPVVSLGFANLPTDSWDFDQEPMTQFKVGVVQQFPRGDSRELQRRQLEILGSEHPFRRADRHARLDVNVSQLWLEAYRARETIRLIQQDRELFEHLVDVAQSSYAAAFGRTRQQDLVRAQLELTRLEDRLALLHEHWEMSRSKLWEWLPPAPISEGQVGDAPDTELAATLPEIALLQPQLIAPETEVPAQALAAVLSAHPAIRSIDRRIDASRAGIELAQQKYRPQWSLNASYGYRDDDPMGDDRADFFSVGVAFDLPLFTSKRQDQQVQSAVASSEALRTERSLALRKMMATFATQRTRLHRLDERRAIYRDRLLKEMHEQAEASLSAYTSDDGDFSEVVRARIAELNARVEALDIEIDRLQTISQLNYFFAGIEDTGEDQP
jgi:outer membrane protein TolC